MPIFRSQLQGEVLAQVFLAPGNHSMSSLARLLGESNASVRREVTRLLDAGVLRDRRAGRTRLLEANADSIAFRPLRDLIMVSFGPRRVVEEEFSGVANLESLYIYGSWAARYRGETGPEPRDIDVLVVGDAVDRDAVYEAAERAEKRLGREVNPTVVSTARWADATEPFLRQLRSRPLVPVVEVAAADDSPWHEAGSQKNVGGVVV